MQVSHTSPFSTRELWIFSGTIHCNKLGRSEGHLPENRLSANEKLCWQILIRIMQIFVSKKYLNVQNLGFISRKMVRILTVGEFVF